jgi:hypothetical protein
VAFNFKNPDYDEVFRLRAGNLNKIRESPAKLPAIKKYYSTNYADFIEDWILTIDPRVAGRPTIMPFLLFPKQREFIEWLYQHRLDGKDGLVEKTRDSGFTYMCGAFAICEWIFCSGSKIGFGSRKQDLVDRTGDPDSIFEKLRFMIRTLPDEFLPEGLSERKHFSFMRILNPVNGSAITGEAGDNIGRGGRSSCYFKDESSFYERPKLIDAALSQNTKCQIDISTVNGVGNPFFLKRHRMPAEDVFIFDWRDDPRKDDEWYADQCQRHSPEIVAQEIDRDYFASTEGICIPAKYVKAAVNFAEKMEIEPSGKVIAGFDPADDDESSDPKGMIIRKGISVYHAEEWKAGNVTESTRRVYGVCKDERVEVLHYDSIGLGAGVKGEIKSLVQLNVKSPYNLTARGINVGKPPTKDEYYEEDKLCVDMFANLKAELYTKLSRRFRRTYEVVNDIKDHPFDDCISIPDNQQLIAELSSFKSGHNEAGKVAIESKAALARRGVPSPNIAEALAVAFDQIQISTAEAMASTRVRIF